jgi:hypothetical protein
MSTLTFKTPADLASYRAALKALFAQELPATLRNLEIDVLAIAHGATPAVAVTETEIAFVEAVTNQHRNLRAKDVELEASNFHAASLHQIAASKCGWAAWCLSDSIPKARVDQLAAAATFAARA